MRRQLARCWDGCLAALLFTAGLAAAAAPEGGGTVEARLEDGGRTVSVTAPGLSGFRGGCSATVEIGGLRQALASDSGTPVGTSFRKAEDTPYGKADVSLSTIRFEKERIELFWRIETMCGVPVLLLQAGIRNIGDRPVNLMGLVPLAMDSAVSSGRTDRVSRSFQISGSPAEWLLTGLHPQTPVVSALSEISKPLYVFECGGFYRHDGAGFLFGPVGEPLAYVYGHVAALGKDGAGLTLTSDMSGVRVEPGAARWGQQVALFMEPPGEALARWPDWVAKTHGARTAKGALSGWESWHTLRTDVTGKDVLAVLDAAEKSGGRLRPEVILIDKGYEPQVGEATDTNAKFPEGLSFYARSIAAAGARPGLRLELLYPSTQAESAVRVRRAVEAGFSYLKLTRGIPPFAPGGIKTVFQTCREDIQEFRRVTGEDTYILYCYGYPDRATLGLVDACRTGDDTGRHGVRAIMNAVLRAYQFNGRWFAVDNDGYYMATEVKDVSPVVGGWPLARTWISMVGLSCGAAFTSDLWHAERFKPYWRNVEILSPPAKERTEVLDLCVSPEWPRLVGHVTREWGDWTVALLWNPLEKEQTVRLDFARIGLDPKRRYAVWSFWDNRYLGVAEGSWTTPFLAPSASQHLCFTELPPSQDRPLLIGSGLHIYCGAAEIKRVTTLRSAMQIELTDAGAREGDLFVYSRFRPVVREAVGCAVEEIKAGGENVWQLTLGNRRPGEEQRIELAILLPVMQQRWFWLLCGLLAAT
ncbi:MAG: hypothetical protein WCK89_07675 [bacterium]